MTPFLTALSIADVPSRNDCAAFAVSPLAIASRRLRSVVRKRDVFILLVVVRFSVWRVRFSAETWFAICCFLLPYFRDLRGPRASPRRHGGWRSRMTLSIVSEQPDTGQTCSCSQPSHRRDLASRLPRFPAPLSRI